MEECWHVGKTRTICKMTYLSTGHTSAKTVIGYATVIMAYGSKCHAIWMNANATVDIQELKELETIQEEADTRMLLHAAHAAKISVLSSEMCLMSLSRL